MEKFDWQRARIYFPEWAPNENGTKDPIYWEGFADKTGLPYCRINFLFRGYGIELIFPTLPEWLPFDETKIGEKPLRDVYAELSHQAHMSVVSELEDSFETLESLRKFVRKYDGRRWSGNLSDHLEFNREGENAALFDYFSFNDGRYPTDVLLGVGDLPESSLNTDWLKYFRHARSIVRGNRSNTTNSIIGSSISDCVRKANEIYKIADELKSLNF